MRRTAIGVWLGLVAVAGCGGEQQGTTVSGYEQERATAAQKNLGIRPATGAKTAVAKTEPSEGAAFGTSSGFKYVSEGRRDPFRSFVIEQALRDQGKVRGPLAGFDLGQLSLVAVVWNTERPRALVTDPSGRAYIVAEGTSIGKNEGTVTRIGDNAMVVREQYVDYVGERTEKEIEMHVRQGQGG